MKILKKQLWYIVAVIVVLVGIVFVPAFTGTRPLSEKELEILTPIYKSHVSLEAIRINIGGPLTIVYPGVTLGNTISFPRGRYHIDIKKHQALLVHEVCHVWQYQHFGLGYIPQSLWEAISQSDTYVVHYDIDKSLREYDVEEQCEIFADIYATGKEEFLPYLEELE